MDWQAAAEFLLEKLFEGQRPIPLATRIEESTPLTVFEKFRYVCRFRPGPFDHRVNRLPGIAVAGTAGRVGIQLKRG
jgi:hypothetical protein